MRKFLFLSAGFLAFSVVFCNAKSHQNTKVKSSSLLWKISGKGLQQPSYLFGTIHLICPDKFLWTKQMKKALDSCKQVAFELDMDDPALSMEVSNGMLLPEGKQLSDYFSQKDYERLEKYATDTLHVPPFMLQRMQPFAILSMTAMTTTNCDEQALSYEQKISGWAKENNQEILGLESAEDQLEVIQEMNIDSTAAQIIQLLNQPKKPEEQYRQLLSAYLNQNLNEIHQLILTSPEIQADLDHLLYERNKKWIPVIEKYIDNKATFIAVGAGHLGGKGGVIDLLKQAGFTVTPVN